MACSSPHIAPAQPTGTTPSLVPHGGRFCMLEQERQGHELGPRYGCVAVRSQADLARSRRWWPESPTTCTGTESRLAPANKRNIGPRIAITHPWDVVRSQLQHEPRVRLRSVLRTSPDASLTTRLRGDQGSMLRVAPACCTNVVTSGSNGGRALRRSTCFRSRSLAQRSHAG
jgi:hypothetical protein